MLGKILIKNKKKHHHHRPSSGGSIRRREQEEQSSPNNGMCRNLMSTLQRPACITRAQTEELEVCVCLCVCVDCPLTEGEVSHLLSNGEEKHAERMVKDSEPRKSLGMLENKLGVL